VTKTLADILKEVDVLKISGSDKILIRNIRFDSRKVEAGDLFFAVKGTTSDGHDFVLKALENGASAIVCEHFQTVQETKATKIQVKDSAMALGMAASAFYGYPSYKMKVVGVTGTNGKTTSVFLLYQLYRDLGYKVGLLSTIENRIGNEIIPSTHTTGDSVQINKNLHDMVEAGCEYCFMEMSSHAIDQKRICGLQIYGAVFTNITHDHLDYHVTFDNYIKAKKQLFDELPAEAFALVNMDDRNGQVMLQNTKARKFTYSLKKMSDFRAKILENQFEGLQLRINDKEIWSSLVGNFNAYNLLAAGSVAFIDRQNADEVFVALSRLKPADGRFQVVPSQSGIVAIVDYAHTPDALKNVLETINDVRQGNEKLVTIIGAGGDRDRLKRPLLAKIACEFSDRVILTSDNPRSEDPEDILNEMEAGLTHEMKRKCAKITNRREAIRTACMISVKGDIILVAGKGHETYQEIRGVKYHFDDREILDEFLNPSLKS